MDQAVPGGQGLNPDLSSVEPATPTELTDPLTGPPEVCTYVASLPDSTTVVLYGFRKLTFSVSQEDLTKSYKSTGNDVFYIEDFFPFLNSK